MQVRTKRKEGKEKCEGQGEREMAANRKVIGPRRWNRKVSALRNFRNWKTIRVLFFSPTLSGWGDWPLSIFHVNDTRSDNICTSCYIRLKTPNDNVAKVSLPNTSLCLLVVVVPRLSPLQLNEKRRPQHGSYKYVFLMHSEFHFSPALCCTSVAIQLFPPGCYSFRFQFYGKKRTWWVKSEVQKRGKSVDRVDEEGNTWLKYKSRTRR